MSTNFAAQALEKLDFKIQIQAFLLCNWILHGWLSCNLIQSIFGIFISINPL